MEHKKSNKADLENKKAVYLELGFVLILAVLLLAFEWGTKPKENELFGGPTEEVIEEDQMQVTRQDAKPPPPPPPPQVIAEINIADNDAEIDEFEFDDAEADEDMEIELVEYEEEEEASEEEVFFIVEDMPRFRGGDQNEFRKFIHENLKYPEMAADMGVSGRVFVQFAVNSKGEVCDVMVVRGVDPSLDKEAMRVVKSSPNWTPGKQRGRPVKVQFTFPIVFKLQD